MSMTEEMMESLIDTCIDVGFFDAQKEVLQASGNGCCVNATYIGLEVLRRLGVDASPSAWDAMVMNEEARLLMMEQTPVDEWPDTAWSLGVNAKTRDANGVGFHAVIQMNEGILDLSSIQFDRPHKNITVPMAMFVSTKDFSGGEIHVEQHGTHYVLYNKRSRTSAALRTAKGFSSDGKLGHTTNLDWINMILEEMGE